MIKAIMIRQDGYRKRVYIKKESVLFREMDMPNFTLMSYEDILEAGDKLIMPIREYRRDRSFIDEWGDEIFIYKESI